MAYKRTSVQAYPIFEVSYKRLWLNLETNKGKKAQNTISARYVNHPKQKSDSSYAPGCILKIH